MLYVIPTPIGNLDDITKRAITTLKGVDFVLAEDTRVSGRLLKHLEIEKPLRSYHNHNEHRTVKGIVSDLQNGQTAALISDAGTPGISDPGYLLVKACIDAQVEIQCLPGATAFVPAIVVSGLPSNRFHFEGFLPHKKGRHTRFQYLATLEETQILYESPHRIKRTLDQLKTYIELDRPVCICRELSKMHEEVIRGTLSQVSHWAQSKENIKGEIVLVIGGKK